jgi:hypothetical protein
LRSSISFSLFNQPSFLIRIIDLQREEIPMFGIGSQELMLILLIAFYIWCEVSSGIGEKLGPTHSRLQKRYGKAT